MSVPATPGKRSGMPPAAANAEVTMMKNKLWGSAAIALALTAGVACEKRTQDEAPGETRTTSAQTDRDSVGQDLRQAGKSLGSAAEKTAVEVKGAAEKAAVEVKAAADKADVKVENGSSCAPAAVRNSEPSCDGGGGGGTPATKRP